MMEKLSTYHPFHGRSQDEITYDMVTGMASFGLPDIYHGAKAAQEGRYRDAYYHVGHAASGYAMWYQAYTLAKAYEMAVKGRALSGNFVYHMAGKAPLIRMGLVGAAKHAIKKIPGILAVSAAAYAGDFYGNIYADFVFGD